MSDDSVYDLDSDINMSTDSLDVTLSPVIGSSHSKKSSKGKRALQLSETDSERRERKKKRKERKRLEKMKRKQAILTANIVSGLLKYDFYSFFICFPLQKKLHYIGKMG
jgi:hypothetical protein